MLKLKKLLSVFITAVLIVTGTVGVVPVHSYAEEAKITYAYIEGSNVNVRALPSKTANGIAQISYSSATVLGSVKNAEGTWYNITYNSEGKQITGYILYNSEYIRIVEYSPDANFDEKLKAFPASYHQALKDLHAAYPNWVFEPDRVNLSFADAVAQQSVNMRKQVQVTSSTVSWRSMGQGSFNWSTNKWAQDNGGWTGASREVIAYYMDPRNFLTSSGIFQFMQQSYSEATAESDVRKITAGTFMANKYPAKEDDPYDGSYDKLLVAAGKAANIDPCVLAAAILQEQGSKGTSSLISGTYKGYEGYYNFFNVGASGGTTAAVIANGLKTAKEKGWNSVPAAIIGGAEFYKKGYIYRYNNATQNQDTYYYQDFNVHNTTSKCSCTKGDTTKCNCDLWHQYAQAVHDANSKGSILNKAYQSKSDYTLKFRIPVYSDMPDSASKLPAKSTNKNNYYFSNISVSGLTPSFNMFCYDYSLYVTKNTVVTVSPVKGATYAGENSYSLKKGDNVITLKVKSQTGYITDYVISVRASIACKLTINVGEADDDKPSTPDNPSSSTPSSTPSSSNPTTSSKPTTSTPSKPSSTPSKVKRGDTNGDGKIAIRDLANIRLHLLGITVLKGNNLTGADTNGDGKITIRDLANVRLHLLGITLLK